MLPLRVARSSPGGSASAVLRALRHVSSRVSRVQAGEDELAQARQWLAKFGKDTIPQSICEVSYSRSSGPGGQNVNKVNSKATMRVKLDDLQTHVPRLIIPTLQSSRFFAKRSDCLVFQADEERNATENAATCFRRLKQAISEAAKMVIPGETSAEQKERVKRLYVLVTHAPETPSNRRPGISPRKVERRRRRRPTRRRRVTARNHSEKIRPLRWPFA
ncbi:hypothetical protein BDY21DRAFT_282129 [Lineolata rhizophorae]|uniref:Prokaryotic-type class I peptide chain release factors domain-containing protein n=1 Tax=Lineolata rhizophorae TaxID=578093 RepID=A0A6A6P6B6_9PEZI|nr:hypothetical protein BDY21DRAFT_282129 [Lineolata rhizophorae]